MKANEAPEKIYLPKEIDFFSAAILTIGKQDGDVEYTRTDAFIERAKKWFEEQNEWFDPNGIRHCGLEDFEDFVNYMKGE